MSKGERARIEELEEQLERSQNQTERALDVGKELRDRATDLERKLFVAILDNTVKTFPRYVAVAYIRRDGSALERNTWTYIDPFVEALKIGDRVRVPSKHDDREGIVVGFGKADRYSGRDRRADGTQYFGPFSEVKDRIIAGHNDRSRR